MHTLCVRSTSTVHNYAFLPPFSYRRSHISPPTVPKEHPFLLRTTARKCITTTTTFPLLDRHASMYLVLSTVKSSIIMRVLKSILLSGMQKSMPKNPEIVVAFMSSARELLLLLLAQILHCDINVLFGTWGGTFLLYTVPIPVYCVRGTRLIHAWSLRSHK